MLGIMGRASKRTALQPSPLSRTNLLNVESSLRLYSINVHKVSTTIIGTPWPPRSTTPDAQKRSNLKTSKDTKSRTRELLNENPATEPILISSDPAPSSSPATRPELDEDEVWADAYEYQEEMLNRPRLSQVSNAGKENVPAGKGLPQVRSAVPENTGNNHGGSFVESAEPPQDGPKDDRFARIVQQYDAMPCPALHKSLKQEEYFSMENNPTLLGRPPRIIYVTNETQLNNVIGSLQGPVLSLDLEWQAFVPKLNISLVQLSDAYTVLLIQICRFPTFPKKLKEIIENPKVIKCGVSIMAADMSRLRDVYDVWGQGVCELSYFARLVDRATHGSTNNLISLTNLSHRYLGSHLEKGPVRCSDWTMYPLSPEQRRYAAVDAYAGYLIFTQLERIRQSSPDLRELWPPISTCPPKPLKKTAPPTKDKASVPYTRKASIVKLSINNVKYSTANVPIKDSVQNHEVSADDESEDNHHFEKPTRRPRKKPDIFLSATSTKKTVRRF